MSTSDDRYLSRKWILHKNTGMSILVIAVTLIACRLFGVSQAPDVTYTLQWGATTMGVVLAAYSTANIVSSKVYEGEKTDDRT